jgi:AcrR family transcriptional regulator
MSAPYDVDAVSRIAELRAQELDPGRIVRHIRQVEADFAEAVEEFLTRDEPPAPGTDERLRITVTARCIAAAVFGAMEVWMLSEERSVPELARLCRTALESLQSGIVD